MSDAGLRALAVFRADRGLRETHVNAGPVLKYGGEPGDAWCGLSVAWCFRTTGNPLPGDGKRARTTGKLLIGWVEWQMEQMQRAGFFALPLAHHPEPGDIIYFHHPYHEGLVDHVGLGRVHTIEGNSGDRVAERSYRLNNKRIAGYARVPDEE